MAIGKSGASLAFVGTVLVIAALLSIQGCSSDEERMDSLVRDYPKRRNDLQQLKDVMLKLKQVGVSGYVTQNANKDELATADGRLVLVSEVVSNGLKESKEHILLAGDIMHRLRAEVVQVGDADSVWIAMRWGGVLAGDLGYLYKGRFDVSKEIRGKYQQIKSEADWYVYFR